MMGEVGVRNACDLWASQSGLLEEESVLMDFIEDNASDIVKTQSFLRLGLPNLLLFVRSPRLAIDGELGIHHLERGSPPRFLHRRAVNQTRRAFVSAILKIVIHRAQDIEGHHARRKGNSQP